jgi:hypothetical protein
MACITVVSYIFHVHHSIAVDPRNAVDSSEVKTKLRGPTKLSVEDSFIAPITFSPTARPTFIPPTPHPTIRPTTSPTTALPTYSPSASKVVTETPTQLTQAEESSKNIVKEANNNIPEISNKDTMRLTPVDEHSRSASSQEDGKADSQAGAELSEHDRNSRSAYLGMLERIKGRSSLQGQSSKSVSAMNEERLGAAEKELLHAEEKKNFYPPHRIPDLALPPGNLQVPPQQATSSDGMIPFDSSLLRAKDKSNDAAENIGAGDATADTNLFQAPDRMKYDLPFNVLHNAAKVHSSEASGQVSKEKIDHCKAQVDPFQSQPVETFVPPASAPFAKVLDWQTEVKNVLSNIGKMRVGGDKLRHHLQDEVNRLRVKRFNTFCEYVE